MITLYLRVKPAERVSLKQLLDVHVEIPANCNWNPIVNSGSLLLYGNFMATLMSSAYPTSTWHVAAFHSIMFLFLFCAQSTFP